MSDRIEQAVAEMVQAAHESFGGVGDAGAAILRRGRRQKGQTMTQMTIFDAIAARHLAEKGIAAASRNKEALIARSRQIAERIALSRADRTVTMDDVAQALFDEGIDCAALGNAAGGVFRTADWRHTGRVVKCQRPLSHGRTIGVWQYCGK